MTRFALTAALFLTAMPVAAQEEGDRGLSLMDRGIELFLDGLQREIEPALRDLEDMVRGMEPAFRSFAQEMGPALRDLMEDVQDWSAYHPPEVLENGDILLRRKTPDETAPPPGETAPEAPREIDI